MHILEILTMKYLNIIIQSTFPLLCSFSFCALSYCFIYCTIVIIHIIIIITIIIIIIVDYTCRSQFTNQKCWSDLFQFIVSALKLNVSTFINTIIFPYAALTYAQCVSGFFLFRLFDPVFLFN